MAALTLAALWWLPSAGLLVVVLAVAAAAVRELHIGHSIVARAVFVGLERAVREMTSLLAGATSAGA